MIPLIAKLIAAFNANSRPGELAAGFSCGFLLALIPGGNVIWAVLFLIFFFLKLHLGTMIFTTVILKLAVGFADPLIDDFGVWILQQAALEPFFIAATNTPIAALSGFNNSLVAGGLITGIILWLPLFFFFKWLVKLYRDRIREKIASSKLVRSFEKVPWLNKLLKAVRTSTAVFEGW